MNNCCCRCACNQEIEIDFPIEIYLISKRAIKNKLVVVAHKYNGMVSPTDMENVNDSFNLVTEQLSEKFTIVKYSEEEKYDFIKPNYVIRKQPIVKNAIDRLVNLKNQNYIPIVIIGGNANMQEAKVNAKIRKQIDDIYEALSEAKKEDKSYATFICGNHIGFARKPTNTHS